MTQTAKFTEYWPFFTAGKMCVGHIPQQFFTGAFKLASLPPKDSRGNHARILCHMPVP